MDPKTRKVRDLCDEVPIVDETKLEAPPDHTKLMKCADMCMLNTTAEHLQILRYLDEVASSYTMAVFGATHVLLSLWSNANNSIKIACVFCPFSPCFIICNR
jgi:hypothetical protein